VTPKPVVEGTQTAIVVGPSGEEIFTDEHGRVKIQFHWDREGKRDENSSCWIRVSQLWAGAGWGAMYIPRIDQEVIVDFLEGDPDKPIIIGRVYHGNNKPPYSLPGEKTKSTIKSDSSLGGGGFNEFRFEDKKGSEEIFLHGQKDWNTVIENNKTEEIGSNLTINVGASKSETIKINCSESILVAKALTIGAGYQVTVGAAMNETVGGAKTEEVGGFKAEAVGAKKTVGIAGNYSETVGGQKSVKVSKDVAEDIGGKYNAVIKKEYSLKAKKITIVAEDEISLNAGKAKVVLKKDGAVLIQGKDINQKASGKVNVKASGDVTIKGSKIKEN
jgi:type VI secretion system secreted protein VgrG